MPDDFMKITNDMGQLVGQLVGKVGRVGADGDGAELDRFYHELVAKHICGTCLKFSLSRLPSDE